MTPLSLLVGIRSVGMTALIVSTALFGLGTVTGAEAAMTDDVSFQETRDDNLDAMANATATVDDVDGTLTRQLLIEGAAKPILKAGTESLNIGLSFGHAHPWLGWVTGRFAGLMAILMGIWPLLGGMD
jgi:hypothetical protein